MHPQLSSPLFLLPYEIRLDIYEYYLLPSNQPSYFLCTYTPIETFLARGPFRRDNIPGLVLACKRLHAELRGLVFDTITFVVRNNYHRNNTGLGSFGFLDLPRIKKVVFVMEYTTHSAWIQHSPVFLRQPEEKWWWWFNVALDRLIARHGTNAVISRDVGKPPPLTGLKEVVFVWGNSTTWYDDRVRWADIGPNGELIVGPEPPKPKCPILDRLAGMKGLETIRLAGFYDDWWAPYLKERTTARVLLEGPKRTSPSLWTGLP